MSAIFHVTSETDWAQARRDGEYRFSTRGVTLEEHGFIHCRLLRGAEAGAFGFGIWAELFTAIDTSEPLRGAAVREAPIG